VGDQFRSSGSAILVGRMWSVWIKDGKGNRMYRAYGNGKIETLNRAKDLAATLNYVGANPLEKGRL
jgi:hypothetical protein